MSSVQLAGPVAAPSPVEVTAGKDDAASARQAGRPSRSADLVIAHESHEDGWWEAIVVAIEKDQLVLRWRDYARQPCVRRPAWMSRCCPRYVARCPRYPHGCERASRARIPLLPLSLQDPRQPLRGTRLWARERASCAHR